MCEGMLGYDIYIYISYLEFKHIMQRYTCEYGLDANQDGFATVYNSSMPCHNLRCSSTNGLSPRSLHGQWGVSVYPIYFRPRTQTNAVYNI